MDRPFRMRLALYQTEIAQNVGTLLRLAACLAVSVDVIEPLGFPWDDKRLRRAGMDYMQHVHVTWHASFEEFWKKKAGRVVLLDVKASQSYAQFTYEPDDILMVGRESDGVPDDVFARCEACVRIPMVPGVRSLNVALSAAIGLSWATQQLISRGLQSLSLV